jgi:methyl-accepting chemotaxis protein
MMTPALIGQKLDRIKKEIDGLEGYIEGLGTHNSTAIRALGQRAQELVAKISELATTAGDAVEAADELANNLEEMRDRLAEVADDLEGAGGS